MDEEGRDENDYQPDMPPLDDAEYLRGYLFDAGPIVNTGMGGVSLRSEHLIAWQKETGVRLSAWEARVLRRLSQEYLAETHRAAKRGCKPPWLAPDFKPEKTALQVSALAKQRTK